MSIPERVSVRAYQVGFGDCLLVGFHYPASARSPAAARHMLIDFGSTRWPKGHAARYREIVDDIATQCRRLDAIVVTHRHKDHLSGFADPQASAGLAALKPRLVMRPWTDDPAAPADAIGDHSRRFSSDLHVAHAFLAEVRASALADDHRKVRAATAALAEHQLASKAAMDNLDVLASEAEHPARYVHAGEASGLAELLPGVKVTVLGPPTVEQWPAVTGRRENDPEYWLGRKNLLEAMLTDAAVPAGLAATAHGPDGEKLDRPHAVPNRPHARRRAQ